MASEQNKKLGLAFAEAVTVSTEDSSDVIARTGAQRVIAALVECCPSCIRHIGSSLGRKGLTGIELNKTLESNGFQKVRIRRAHRENPVHGVGLCLFRFRKWRSTDAELSKWELYKSWERLVEVFPIFAQECDWNKFYGVCRKYNTMWSQHLELARLEPRLYGADFEQDAGSAPALSVPAGFLPYKGKRNKQDDFKDLVAQATLKREEMARLDMSGACGVELLLGNSSQAPIVVQGSKGPGVDGMTFCRPIPCRPVQMPASCLGGLRVANHQRALMAGGQLALVNFDTNGGVNYLMGTTIDGLVPVQEKTSTLALRMPQNLSSDVKTNSSLLLPPLCLA